MSSDARLLIIEMVLPARRILSHRGKIIDMAMLVATGGQERTETEYAALLAKLGLCLTRLSPQNRPSALSRLVSPETCNFIPRTLDAL